MIDKNRRIDRPTPQSAFLQNMEVDAARLLRRHWPIMVLSLLIGWGASAAYFLLVPPTYESEAEILLMPKDPGLATRGVENKREVDSTLSDDLLATHMLLVQSPAIVKTALTDAKLMELPSLLDSMDDDDRTVVDYVIRQLYVSRGGEGKAKNAQVLRVAMRHGNAEDAQNVVAAVVKEFQIFIDKKYKGVNEEAAGLITKAQETLAGELEYAEKKYREFREEAPLFWNGEKSTNIFQTEYEQIESMLTDLRMQRSELDSRLALVQSQLAQIKEEGGNDIEKLALVDEKSAERIRIFLEIYGGKAESQMFQAQQPERLEAARGEYEGLLKLQARLQSLILDFGDEHAEVRALRNEIKTVQEFIDSRSGKLQIAAEEEVLTASKLVDAYVSLLKHDLKAMDDREVLLVKNSRIAEAKAKELVHFELDGEMKRMAVDRQKELFDATVDRLREINLAKDFGGFVNEVIKAPEVGIEVWPKLSVCGALGTLGGLVLGFLGAFASEMRNRSLRSVQDIEQVSGVSTISLVPKLEVQRDPRSKKSIAASGSKVAPVIVTHHFPHCREAEVFRGLRTTLLFKLHSSKAKVIAVTSPSSGDGKSTVLANLATSLAQAGRRVLLIDADMRRPTVAKIFGINHDMGLADALRKGAPLSKVIVKSECEGLDLILSGAVPDNPAELLSSPALKELLDAAKDEYDLVLVDCPPVLAVADPCVVATSVDAVMVVLRINPKSRVELQRTKELLAEVHGNVIGTVVNASRLESSDGRGSDEYGVGYGYGSYGSRANAYFNNEPSRKVKKDRFEDEKEKVRSK